MKKTKLFWTLAAIAFVGAAVFAGCEKEQSAQSEGVSVSNPLVLIETHGHEEIWTSTFNMDMHITLHMYPSDSTFFSTITGADASTFYTSMNDSAWSCYSLTFDSVNNNYILMEDSVIAIRNGNPVVITDARLLSSYKVEYLAPDTMCWTDRRAGPAIWTHIREYLFVKQ